MMRKTRKAWEATETAAPNVPPRRSKTAAGSMMSVVRYSPAGMSHDWSFSIHESQRFVRLVRYRGRRPWNSESD